LGPKLPGSVSEPEDKSVEDDRDSDDRQQDVDGQHREVGVVRKCRADELLGAATADLCQIQHQEDENKPEPGAHSEAVFRDVVLSNPVPPCQQGQSSNSVDDCNCVGEAVYLPDC
jgi:hypothetical protein